MTYWAKVDENNLVIRVTEVLVNDSDKGHKWLVDNFKGTWLETSYNTYGGTHYTNGEPSDDQSKALRFNYAGVGYTYDPARDAFIPPSPYQSWVLNEATCLWEPPIDMPSDDMPYIWDEDTVSWIEMETSDPS